MKSKILVQVLLMIIIVFVGCSSRNIVAISNDWLEHTEQIEGIVAPDHKRILIQDKDTIRDFFNLMNSLEYDRTMTMAEDRASEKSVFPPGTEYLFFLTSSKFDDKLHIIYGKRDQALGVGDEIYFLNKDISEEIKKWIDEAN